MHYLHSNFSTILHYKLAYYRMRCALKPLASNTKNAVDTL